MLVIVLWLGSKKPAMELYACRLRLEAATCVDILKVLFHHLSLGYVSWMSSQFPQLFSLEGMKSVIFQGVTRRLNGSRAVSHMLLRNIGA